MDPRKVKVILNESLKITGILVDDYENKKDLFDFHDGAIVGLFETIIQKSEDIVFLLENKKYASIESLVRVVFETHIYLLYILSAHTENKGKAYSLSVKIDELDYFEKTIGDKEINVEIRKFLNLNKEDAIKRADELLKDHPDSNTYQEYSENIRKQYKNLFFWNKGKKVNRWYNANSKINNFSDLCKYIDKEVEYQLLYGLLSKDTHGKSALNTLQMQPHELNIIEINTDPDLVLSVLGDCLLQSSREVLKYKRLNRELKKYDHNIRTKFNVINMKLK